MRLALLALAAALTTTPTPPEAALFHADGRPATLADVLAAARQADVLFLGEHHDDPSAHALEKTVLDAVAPGLGAKRADSRPVALSLEMFDRDVQPVLDEYLNGQVREKDFLAAARPWPNYAADYRPLVELARDHHVPVLAADPPARYVSRVGRLGTASLAELPAPAHAWLAPSPWPSPSLAYTAKFQAFAAEAAGPGHSPAPGPALRAMFEAQWLRDLTMAATIADWLRANPGLVVHVTGVFHAEGGLGTPAALRHYRPGVRTVVLAIAPDKGYPAFQPATMSALGDFVAVTPPTKR